MPVSDEVLKFYVGVGGMDVGEMLEKYGLGGTVLILALTYVLYVVHLWLGFERVVGWWVVLLFAVYLMLGIWDLVGVYVAGSALRSLFVDGDIWRGYVEIGVVLLIIIAIKLKEVRDRCT